MYPLKFIPIYKERIWGGSQLATLLNRSLPPGKIGESWEICCHSQGMSEICNGGFAGRTLQDLIQERPRDVLGFDDGRREMSLLVKVLSAEDHLSVQVHPDDAYALGQENERGKTEAWYVVAARPGAQIIYGLREEFGRESFLQAVENGAVLTTLRYVTVAKGDLIYVPSGMVHALGEGVTVYEVQQNSDTTYRVYDYDRRDAQGRARDLHLDKALDVIRFGPQETIDFSRQEIHSPFFQMTVLHIDGNWEDDGGGRYIIYCVVAGQGILHYATGEEPLAAGDTLLVPATLTGLVLRGQLEVLRIRENVKI